MRFDRRVTYPLFDKNNTSDVGLETDVFAETVISPVRVGGVIKSPGIATIPVNKLVGSLKQPYLYKIAAGHRTSGGTSPFFGSRR